MSSNIFGKGVVNWSEYQDKQLDVLANLESSFKSSLSTGKKLESAMESLYKSVDHLANDPASYKKGADSASRMYKTIESAMDSQRKAEAKHAGAISSIMNKFGVDAEEATRRFNDAAEKQRATGKYIYDGAVKLFSTLGDIADSWSKSSNQLIKISGMDGDAVRQYRSDLTDIVAQMNKTTGYAFNSLESYQNVMSTLQGVTGDLDAMKEMSRPLLLAGETLPMNLTNISELFNKFYVRYNFSSKNMEDVLDQIRGNTAGNSANAESVAEAMTSLSSDLELYSGGDSEKLEQALEQVTNYVTQLESMSVDPSTSTAVLKNLLRGDYDANTLGFLSVGGMTVEQLEQSRDNLDLVSIINAYNKGISELGTSIFSAGDHNWTVNWSNRGVDPDYARAVLSATSNGNYDKLFTPVDTTDTSTMEELVEDKYYSLATKAENYMSSVTEMLASIQEKVGIGFSDFVAIGNIIATALVAKGVLGGSGLSLGRLGGGLKGLLGASGPSLAGLGGGSGLSLGGLGGAAMLGGGILAGGALGINGISGVFDSNNDTMSKVLSGAQGALGIGGAGALVALGVSNPIGWAALAASGGALLVKSIHQANTAYKEGAKIVSQEFGNVSDILEDEALERNMTLDKIKDLASDESTLEEAKKELISTGLLSTEDLNSLTDMNGDALTSLINSYQDASNAFDEITQQLLDKYSEEQQEGANATNKSIADWFSSNRFIQNDTNEAILKQMGEAVNSAIQAKRSAGASLTKDEEKFLAKYQKYYNNDGNINQSEYNSLLSIGTNLSLLYNNVSGSDLQSLTEKINYIDPNSGITSFTYRDPNDIKKYVSPVKQAFEAYQSSQTDENKEALEKALASAKGAGLSKKTYTDLAVAAQAIGYTYAQGINYVPHDQLALIHEGEAVVPKRFNPAANNIATAEDLEKSDRHRTDAERKSQETMKEFLKVTKEIKILLSAWKKNSESSKTTYAYNSSSSSFTDIARAALSGFTDTDITTI